MSILANSEKRGGWERRVKPKQHILQRKKKCFHPGVSIQQSKVKVTLSGKMCVSGLGGLHQSKRLQSLQSKQCRTFCLCDHSWIMHHPSKWHRRDTTMENLKKNCHIDLYFNACPWWLNSWFTWPWLCIKHTHTTAFKWEKNSWNNIIINLF